MNFSEALVLFKAGRRLRRAGRLDWIQLQGQTFTELAPTFGFNSDVNDYIPSAEDLLADDWEAQAVEEVTLQPTGELGVANAFGMLTNDISFFGNSGEILRLAGDGGVYLRGRLVEHDEELVHGLRDFLGFATQTMIEAPNGSVRCCTTRFERILES